MKRSFDVLFFDVLSFDVLSSVLCALLLLGCDAAGPGGGADPGGDAAAAPILGRWTVATDVVDLASGPVSVVLGGAATQSWVSSNLGANIWGTKLSYAFEADGTYRAAYRARAVSGVFVSETEVEETGRFALDGTQLTLTPTRQVGWIYIGHPSHRQEIDVADGPARSYEVGLVETAAGTPYLFLLGPCGPFQIEPWCERDDVKRDVGVLYEPTP